MHISNIKVQSPIHIKEVFYNQAVKDIKKILKSPTFKYSNAIIKDDYDNSEHMFVTICYGYLITFGCDDGLPWTEAHDISKLIVKMATIGFTPSFFQVQPLEKNEKSYKESEQNLNFGFVKKVPRKEVIKS